MRLKLVVDVETNCCSSDNNDDEAQSTVARLPGTTRLISALSRIRASVSREVRAPILVPSRTFSTPKISIG